MKTLTEIEELKASWESDPHWDIEDTEGFEDHEEELAAYRMQKVDEWHRESMQKIKDKAAEIGCPDNLKLAEYVMSLEGYVISLESRIEKLEKE